LHALEPRAARAALQVVLEVGVAARRAADLEGGGLSERSAPEVGVDDDSGGVEDAPRRGPLELCGELAHVACEGL
jgi:hypothetical protein